MGYAEFGRRTRKAGNEEVLEGKIKIARLMQAWEEWRRVRKVADASLLLSTNNTARPEFDLQILKFVAELTRTSLHETFFYQELSFGVTKYQTLTWSGILWSFNMLANKDLNIKAPFQQKSKESMALMHLIPPLLGIAWKCTPLVKKQIAWFNS